VVGMGNEVMKRVDEVVKRVLIWWKHAIPRSGREMLKLRRKLARFVLRRRGDDPTHGKEQMKRERERERVRKEILDARLVRKELP
jgi:hypothetical protein